MFGLGFNRGKWIFNDYLPAHSRGEPSSFPVAEKNQNATAAPDAMKVSGLANVVRAAPVKAEQRLLKFSASVTDKNNCVSPS